MHELVARIVQTLDEAELSFEIILVDDGSPDQSWSEVQKIKATEPRLKGIKLSRNFGQHKAITAGLDHVSGQWVVVMDCDLQDRPEEIPALYAKALEGFDLVLAQRVARQDSWLKRFSSAAFYRTLAYLTGSEQDESVGNFGIYHQKVIAQVTRLRESIRYFPTMVKWVGFRSTTLEVKHAARTEGKSNYNFSRLMNLALDIMLAYSDKPLRMAVKFGFFIALLGLLMAVWTAYKWFAGEVSVLGYASIMISIWVLTGSILVSLGMVGLYVGKTFEGVRNRPIYVVDEVI